MNRGSTILLGRVSKPHGISGELIVRQPFGDIPVPGDPETVFILIDGIQVPFFVETRRQTDASVLILKIKGIDDKAKAARYTGKKIYVEGPVTREKNVRQDDLLEGFAVIDSGHGKLGTVKDTIPFRENPLLLVAGKDREFYLPVRGNFIDDIDTQKKAIFVSLPDGFLQSQE